MLLRFKFYFYISIVVGLLFSASFVFAQTPASVDLPSLIIQLQSQIKALQAQVVQLQSQLEVTQKETTATKEELKTTKEEVRAISEELKLTRFLRKGESGEEVKKLQEFLSQFPDIYPEKLVTGFFGARTEAAIKKLQEKHGIETVGNVGPNTLPKINL